MLCGKITICYIFTKFINKLRCQLGFTVVFKYKSTITFSIYKHITFSGQQPISFTSSLFSNIPVFPISFIDFIFFTLNRH